MLVRNLDKSSIGTPWSGREWIEGLLNISRVTLKPALRSERLDVVTPNPFITMNCVTGDAQNSSCGEILLHNHQSAFWRNSRQSEGGRRVQAETLVYAGIKIRQTFDLFFGCNFFILNTKLLVKLLVQIILCAAISSQIVKDRADGAEEFGMP